MKLKLAAAVSCAAVTIAQRSTVSLDLGWRTKLGVDPDTSGVCKLSYPTNLAGVTCGGLTSHVEGSASASACQAAACAINADVWQYNASNSLCMIGAMGTCTAKSGAAWVGGAKNGTNQTWLPPASQPGFDDSAWEVVDVPHDFEITGQYGSQYNKGEAYLPFNQSFYRKHFQLPSSWSDSYVEVEIEGALSTSSWWINGVQILNLNYAGYIPLTLRLDNVPGAPLKFGPAADNVLVGFIDGSETTGEQDQEKGATDLSVV